jgi:hypothetical protein
MIARISGHFVHNSGLREFFNIVAGGFEGHIHAFRQLFCVEDWSPKTEKFFIYIHIPIEIPFILLVFYRLPAFILPLSAQAVKRTLYLKRRAVRAGRLAIIRP